MEIKDCKGCRSEIYMKLSNISYTVCGVLHLHIKRKLKTVKNISICPCQNCIIKMICNIQCKQYERYKEMLFNLSDFQSIQDHEYAKGNKHLTSQGM